MMKKIVLIMTLLTAALLTGCADISPNTELQDFYKASLTNCGLEYSSCMDDYSNLKIEVKNNYIHENKLHFEASENCYLIITDGSMPIVNQGINLIDLRLLNIESQDISSISDNYDYEWKYWLGCNVKFR
jgi:hypothetical protein